MKKLFLLLALALLLILPLAFVGCDEPEESSSPEPDLPPEPEMIEVPSEELFANMVSVDQKVAASIFYKFSISDADNVYDYVDFIIVRKNNYSSEDPAVLVSTDYSFINKNNGKVISYTLDNDVTSDDDNYASSLVSLDYGYLSNSDFFAITLQYGSSTNGKVDHVVYNIFGEKVFEKLALKNEDELEEMLDKDDNLNQLASMLSTASLSEVSYIAFDDCVYLIDNEKLTLEKVLDPSKQSSVVFLQHGSLTWLSDKECFRVVDNDSIKGIRSVAVIDKKLNLVSEVTFSYNAKAGVNYFYLSNNSIIFVETTTLLDDADEFDCYSSGKKTNVRVYLVDAESGEKKELDNSIVPTNAFSGNSYFDLKSEDMNIFYYYEIFDQTKINHKNLIVLDGEGKPVKTLEPFFALDDYTNLSVTQNGMVTFDKLGAAHYLDASGKVLSTVFSNVSTSYNNLWLITKSDIDSTVNIYSNKLELIYTLPEGTTLYRTFNNSLILKKEIKEPELDIDENPTGAMITTGYEYLLFKGDATNMTSIFVEKVVRPTEGTVKSFYSTSTSFFIIEEENVETGDVSYKIYDDLGESKATIGAGEQFTSYIYGEYIDAPSSNIQRLITMETVDNGTDPVYYVYHIYFVNSDN